MVERSHAEMLRDASRLLDEQSERLRRLLRPWDHSLSVLYADAHNLINALAAVRGLVKMVLEDLEGK
jgi:hypothetical protein